jgi:pilus assembly protein CpaB
VGGIAIKLVLNVVANAQGASQASMVKCAVAKVDIGFAEEITPEKLVLVDWPKDSLPDQHFETIEDLQDRVTNMFIPKDVPIYPTMLAQAGTPPGIQTRIKQGYRAVSVGIDEITGVAYQLKPGDWVDVISLVDRKRRDGKMDTMSRVILESVEIAAVGRALHSGKPGDAPKSIARSVTLLLKPQDVTTLHLAQSKRGKISLALRGNMDDVQSDTHASASNEHLMGMDPSDFSDAEQSPSTEPEPEPVKFDPLPTAVWSVTVLNGNDIRQVEYTKLEGRWVQTGSMQQEPEASPSQPTPG